MMETPIETVETPVETSTMLNDVKLALRICTTAFDGEIEDIIADCTAELEQLGIGVDKDDPQTKSAIIMYAKTHFGNAGDAEKWEKLYRSKVTKLQIASGVITNG